VDIRSRVVQEASIAAVVVRCGCGDPASHFASVCPRPRAVEDCGVVSYWHRSFWRRLLFKLFGRVL
jgi:hypothetical protein